MAELKYGSIVTVAGKIKIARAMMEGKQIKLKYFAAGDGNGAYYKPQDSQTSLKREKWRGQITEAKINKDSPNLIEISTVIPPEEGGFTIREIAAFDENNEMIVIANTPDTEKVILKEGIAGEIKLVIYMEIANSDVVELKVDPHAVIATKSDIIELKKESDGRYIKTSDYDKDGDGKIDNAKYADIENGITCDVKIEGDADTYYPVVFSVKGPRNYSSKLYNIFIFKYYQMATSGTGTIIDIKYHYTDWGGHPPFLIYKWSNRENRNIFGGAKLTYRDENIVVYLKGKNQYYVRTNSEYNIKIYYDTFNTGGQTFPIRKNAIEEIQGNENKGIYSNLSFVPALKNEFYTKENIDEKIDSLKKSVVNGKRALVNDINKAMGSSSNLTENNSFEDFGNIIKNNVGYKIKEISFADFKFSSAGGTNAIYYYPESKTIFNEVHGLIFAYLKEGNFSNCYQAVRTKYINKNELDNTNWSDGSYLINQIIYKDSTSSNIKKSDNDIFGVSFKWNKNSLGLCFAYTYPYPLENAKKLKEKANDIKIIVIYK